MAEGGPKASVKVDGLTDGRQPVITCPLGNTEQGDPYLDLPIGKQDAGNRKE